MKYLMKSATMRSYLIFVIFFTQAKILDRKFYTEERVIYGKRISRQNSVNCYLLAQANYKYQDHDHGHRGVSFVSQTDEVPHIKC